MKHIKSYREVLNEALSQEELDDLLNIAISNRDLNSVKYALDSGANIEADLRGETPLLKAARFGHDHIVKFLVDNGANIGAVGVVGYTTLHYGAQKGNINILKLFIELGANIDARDNSGRTPLMIAADYHNLSAVEYLLDQGANIDAEDNFGRTALHAIMFVAPADRNLLPILDLLIDKGANVNARDIYGKTPISYSANHTGSVNHLREVTRILLINGADPFVKFKDIDELKDYFEGDLSWAPIELQKKWERMAKGKSTFGI